MSLGGILPSNIPDVNPDYWLLAPPVSYQMVLPGNDFLKNVTFTGVPMTKTGRGSGEWETKS